MKLNTAFSEESTVGPNEIDTDFRISVLSIRLPRNVSTTYPSRTNTFFFVRILNEYSRLRFLFYC